MSENNSLEALREVIAKLTGDDGCGWDKEQTPLTLADYVIEESHELVSAIRDGNAASVCEELGDVFFLLLFIAGDYEKKGIFTLKDVLDTNRCKMIRRHPHVFGDKKFDNLDSQLAAWEKIKKEEQAKKGAPHGVYASLPASLPPLIKAYRIHSRAARTGFTWADDEEVEQQVESEWLEFLDAIQSGNEEAQKHEFGDILFSLVELGRRKGIKASEALDLAARRFLKRFSRMEEMAASEGKDIGEMDLDSQDELWSRAKAEEEKAADDRG